MDYTLQNTFINFQESVSKLFIEKSEDSIKAYHFEIWEIIAQNHRNPVFSLDMSPQAPRTTMEAKIRDFVLGQM
jgi:hypothetical protein